MQFLLSGFVGMDAKSAGQGKPKHLNTGVKKLFEWEVKLFQQQIVATDCNRFALQFISFTFNVFSCF